MTWIAIPFALVTVLAAFGGGLAALRLSRDLTTAIALTAASSSRRPSDSP